uniref:Uncharacterized protein n=1 Tax=Panagrolaimus superbus TaxID=310955 RepID=A0A914YUC8_9BILA
MTVGVGITHVQPLPQWPLPQEAAAGMTIQEGNDLVDGPAVAYELQLVTARGGVQAISGGLRIAITELRALHGGGGGPGALAGCRPGHDSAVRGTCVPRTGRSRCRTAAACFRWW